MSREYPCIHYKPDGICAKYSVNGDLSYCVQGPCPNETPSNADRIRSMSDEELAEFLSHVHDDPCESCCGNLYWCRRNNAPEPICQKHFLEWLQQPKKEGH